MMNVKIHASPSGKEQCHPSRDARLFSEKKISFPVRHVVVMGAATGLRLDRFLKEQFPGVPFSYIQRLLRTGQVRVNSGRARGRLRLVAGDDVRLPPVSFAMSEEKGVPPESFVQAVRGRIIWQDEHLLVLDKPEGMAVHGGSGHSWGVVDAVRRLVQLEGREPLFTDTSLPPDGNHPELCHRLDKGTSGCLLFALNMAALRRMATAFREGTVGKVYVALVRGHPRPEVGVIDLPLSKGIVRSGERMVVSTREGLPARTRYRVLMRFAHASLVQITLESGRTHQIRVHFQSMGYPLAGDRKYGDTAFNNRMKKTGLNRLFLHAQKLVFLHPITGAHIALEAPLDEKLTRVVSLLDTSGG